MKQHLHGNKVRAMVIRSGYMIKSFTVHGDNTYSATLVGKINPDNLRIDLERNILDNTGTRFTVEAENRGSEAHQGKFTDLYFVIREYVEPVEELTDSQKMFAQLAEQDETIAEVLGHVIPVDALLDAATPDTRPVVEDPMIKTLVQPGDKRCACGCGEKVYSKKATFAQGHDAKAKSMLRKFSTGKREGKPDLTAELITYIGDHAAWYDEFASLLPGWTK